MKVFIFSSHLIFILETMHFRTLMSHLNNSQTKTNKIFWSDETKIDVFELNSKCHEVPSKQPGGFAEKNDGISPKPDAQSLRH